MWQSFKILCGKERKIAAEGSDESMSLTGNKYLCKTQNISILILQKLRIKKYTTLRKQDERCIKLKKENSYCEARKEIQNDTYICSKIF